jgi:transcriptional regulator with XRE-family HTH domain
MTPDNIKKTISRKLEFLRKHSGETNEVAADTLDIDLSEFYRILKGHRMPKLSTFLRINQKYGMKLDWWFGDLADAPLDKNNFRQRAFELQILNLTKKLDAQTQKAVLAMLKILVK